MFHLTKKLFVLMFALVCVVGLVVAPAVYADDPDQKGIIALENPLTVNTPAELIGLVINSFLGLIGSIALIVFIIGGIVWMTSGGEKEKVQKGLDTMIWAAIGMAVIFASAALVRFVLERLVQ